MVRSKKLNGKLVFYNTTNKGTEAKKKVTKAEVKQFIKKNYEVINPETLTADQRKYLGAVKGGKNRAANSLVNKEGHFLPKALQDKALKNLGIDIEQLKKDKNLKTIREVFKDNKPLQKSFDKLISVTGIELWYSDERNKSVEKIESYTGDEIYYNGFAIEKMQLAKIVGSFIRKCHRTFDLYYPGVAIRFVYFGTDILTIIIEEGYILETGEDTENVQLYHANKA